MNKAFLALVLVIAALVAVTQARTYAVLVAGSYTYSNYRHQSDIMRNYHNLRARGFRAEDIITFAYDDIANHRSNPFPGATYNFPAANGVNFYEGVQIDYAGRDVTPQNFLNVLTGNSTGVGPVLKTGPNDNILIIMNDHGAPGLFAFPTTELYVKDFKAALDYIIAENKAQKVAIYIEACESGSMCDKVIPNGAPIVCMTASDGNQSSWAKYCGSDAYVNGKSIGSCLSNEFAQATNVYLDEFGVDGTLAQNFQYLKQETTRSPAQIFYGNEAYTQWKVAEFFAQVGFTPEQDAALIAEKKQANASTAPLSNNQMVSSRDNDLQYLVQKYLDTEGVLGFQQRITAGEELLQEITHRVEADKRFTRIAQKVLESQQSNSSLLGAVSAAAIHEMKSEVAAIECGKCCTNAYQYISKSACKFTDYSLKYAKTIHNLCTMGNNNILAVMSALKQECQF